MRAALESHGTPRLKAASAALEEATQELAAVIVEQAMEESATDASPAKRLEPFQRCDERR